MAERLKLFVIVLKFKKIGESVNWLNSLGYTLDCVTDVQILFGDQILDPIINKIIVASKYLIFKSQAKKRITWNFVAPLLYMYT